SLRLQKDLARSGVHIVAFVDYRAVDDHRDFLAGADTFYSGPVADLALDIVFATGVEQLFEIGIVQRPPELLAGVDGLLAAFFPAGAAIRAQDGVAGKSDRNRFAGLVLAANDDEIADAALGELTLDRGHPGAARGAAVRADGMQENAGIAHILSA